VCFKISIIWVERELGLLFLR